MESSETKHISFQNQNKTQFLTESTEMSSLKRRPSSYKRKSKNVHMLRPPKLSVAMAYKMRMWTKFKIFLSHLKRKVKTDDDDDEENNQTVNSANSNPHSIHRRQQQFRILPLAEAENSLSTSAFACIERCITAFTIWCYKTSSMKISIVITLFYFVIILFFAMCLFALNELYDHKFDRQCMTSWNYSRSATHREANFEYSFDLSWTTFSTVGYGLFGPSENIRCWGIRFLCALEAFCGVMYAALCGSVLFARIMRILAQAPVAFSGPVCIYYGSSWAEESKYFSFIARHPSEMEENVDVNAFPTLEFRIVNNFPGDHKAIIDVNISCTAILTYSEEKLKEEGYISEKVFDSRGKARTPVNHIELKLETEKIPYFDTVCYIQHILDESSPLLKDSVRQEIAGKSGWPTHLNNYEEIRNSLKSLHSIVVLFNGIHTVSAGSVSATTIYTSDDFYIGWKFVGMLYEENDDYGNRRVKCDCDLIHDIVPQDKGGFEPL